MDEFRRSFKIFISSRPHAHAPEEVLAAVDILRDELDELEPEDQVLMIRAQEMIQKCKTCRAFLKDFVDKNSFHGQTAIP